MASARLQHLLVVALGLMLVFCAISSAAEETGEDYLDYEEQDELATKLKLKMDERKIIALNRDWLARREPNRTPTAGFFSPWVVTLLIIAGTFAVVALVSGMLHLFGCGGKRPISQSDSQKGSLASVVDAKKRRPSLMIEKTHE